MFRPPRCRRRAGRPRRSAPAHHVKRTTGKWNSCATLEAAHLLHGMGAPPVPNPYKPPVPNRTQAVQTARGFRRRRLPQRWRRLWLVPLLGLLPVVVAVVLASEGYFSAPSAPVALP